MNKSDTIIVTGAAGMVGSHLASLLRSQGYLGVVGLTRSECDMLDRDSVHAVFAHLRPSYVFHCAGRVFGLAGNKNHHRQYVENCLINTHVIEASSRVGVQKIVGMGTVAMYPNLNGAAYKEDMLWGGAPHDSEKGYGHAKRGMLAQLEASGIPFACAVSTNLYGPGDRFNTDTGHVIPALIRKFHEARRNGGEVIVWGDGSAMRDFMHVSDAATALLILMDRGSGPVNLATGVSHSIKDVAGILSERTGNAVVWEKSGLVGQHSRHYDVSRLDALKFICQYDLARGLSETFDWYCRNHRTARTA